MSCAQEIFQLRKENKLKEALAKVRECYAEDDNDIWLQRAYGWVLYDLIKNDVAAFKAKDRTPGYLANRFNTFLHEYSQFGENIRPDLLHSMLLTQVLKGSRVWSGFLDFARWWGIENFREDDKQTYKLAQGREIASLETRFVYAVGREASKRFSEIGPDMLDWAESLVDAALKTNSSDQWLHYFKSKLLMEHGQVEKARECLLPVARRQQNAAWVWTLLGRTYEKDEPEKAITSYYRAVQLAVKPQEVAKTRISLAQLLVEQKRFDDAAVQICLALKYRSDGDYRIPQELAQMAGANWYSKLATRNDLPKEPDVAGKSDSILFDVEQSQIKYRLGVVDNQNLKKKLAHVAFSADDGVVLMYRRFKGIDTVNTGDFVEVGFLSGDKRPARWRRSDATHIEGLIAELSGKVSQLDGQAFGFMRTNTGERAFVSPDLMTEQPVDWESIKNCVAVMGNKGWRVLHWI